MQSKTSWDRFRAASAYTHPVDIKKLRFVYDEVGVLLGDGESSSTLRALEVGCGVGGITLPLGTLGAQVTGVDLDADDVAELRDRAARLGLSNVEAFVGDAYAFESAERFDVAIASEVFEHLRDPGRLAGVLARHLSPGGLLLVTTPNGYGPWEQMNSLKLVPRRWGWLRRLLGKEPHDGGGREHEQRYTRRRLEALLRAAGFEPLRWRNSDFVLTLSRRMRASETFGALDCKLGDLVPHWMASGWYAAFKKH
jgi:2-polyprenyl-3-methyl-5-hydroxy-6-metoxy-1,4-benzoquinol methylase